MLLGKFSPVVNALTVGAKPRPLYNFCSAHSNSYFVDPFGLIYPCIPSVGVEALAIGRYYPVHELKANGIHTRSIETIGKCINCIYSLFCGGGCPLRIC